MRAAPNAPLSDVEVDALDIPICVEAPALLAVSGGADSMTLMHLAAQRAQRMGSGSLLVATVDHGLRPESAHEARFVAAEAGKLGLRHVTLHWKGAKPSSGLQESAREARYRLLSDLCERQGSTALVTAHTQDDQAETFLMRLARGSGLDGLVGMERVADLFGVRVVRPFLEIPKSRLIATLTHAGHPWIEDPSNENAGFERVRIRQALRTLEQVGISAEAIALSTRRLAVARKGLVSEVESVLADVGRVKMDQLGYAVLSRSIWTGEPSLGEAVRLRVLGHLIGAVGGHARLQSLRALESLERDLSSAMSNGDPIGATLGRARITWRGKGVIITREAGRDPPQQVVAAPGGRMVWDNRFDLTFADTCPTGLTVRSLGSAGLKVLRQLKQAPGGTPAEVFHTLPALWLGEQLVAVASLTQPGLAPGTSSKTAHNGAPLTLWSSTFRGWAAPVHRV